MEKLTFSRAMSKGHYRPELGADECSYCIFLAPLEEPVTAERIRGDTEHLLLELTYGPVSDPGALRLRQMGTNVVIEESAQGLFLAFLEDRSVNYIGQLIMLALRFKIETLAAALETCTTEMKQLEDELDSCMDNAGTYRILDFRRTYTEYGRGIINLGEILARINKGYFPMQMQNSYVLQGQVELEFDFLEQRYELLKNTIIKDLDTYTSIINNNINRSARLLSLISLVGVVLNFLFGSLLIVHPLLGILGGVLIASLSAGAVFLSYLGKRGTVVELGEIRSTAGLPAMRRLLRSHPMKKEYSHAKR